MHNATYHPGAAGLLAPLASWLDDPQVSEIMVNQPQQVFVEAQGVITAHHVLSLTERHLARLCNFIANKSRQILSDSKPLLAANIDDDSRVQIVLPPIAKHLTLCIRRQVVKQLSLEEYAKTTFYQHAQRFAMNPNHHTNSSESNSILSALFQAQQWDEFIKQAITLKQNIVISGGTASGKTTFLKACLNHIPPAERIITLEDTREIHPSHPNQVQLLAFKGEQGNANMTMQDLLQCALRLRPDRIILGEIRGREILDFIAAASTGHAGSLTTIHANNPRIAFMRMVQLYKLNNVPAMTDEQIRSELHEVIDVIIQLTKTLRGRQVTSIYYKNGEDFL